MKPSDKAKYLSILLKLIVILAAAVGIYRTATAGRGSFMGGSRVFMFFTIQSNIAVALICAVGLWLLFRHTPPKTVWYVIQFVGAVSITLTGVVFAFVLAPTLGSHAWNVQNVLTHVVVPVAAVADFFVTGVYGTLQKRHIPLVTLPPLAYAIYAGIGYLAGWEFLKGVELGQSHRRIRIYKRPSVHGHRLVDPCHFSFSAGDRIRVLSHFGSFEKANVILWYLVLFCRYFYHLEPSFSRMFSRTPVSRGTAQCCEVFKAEVSFCCYPRLAIPL